jgi:hypothetical protein
MDQQVRGRVFGAELSAAPGAGVFDQGPAGIEAGIESNFSPGNQDASLRVGPRRVTAPPSPSMISVSPRSA